MNVTHSNRLLLCCAIAIVTGVLLTAHADGTPDYGRYKVIVDRSPFGSAPVPGAQDAQPSFASRYGFVGLVGGKDGNIVAIVEDKESTPRRSYFVAESDTFNGIKILRIERDPSRIVLQSGMETATLAYEARGGGGGPGAPAPQPAPGGQPPGLNAPPTAPNRRTPFIQRIMQNE